MSATIDLGRVTLLGIEIELANALRDLIMIAVTIASLTLTPQANRAENGFSWGPIKEVAKLFAGIFVAIIPVLAMLEAGSERRLRAARRARDRTRTAAPTTPPISGSRAASRRSSTMRRPISCSSSSPAAMRSS